MKSRKITVFFLIVVVVLLLCATYLTFFYSPKEDKNIGYRLNLGDKIQFKDINYKEKYKDNIINEDTLSYEYEIIHEKSVLYGKVYIDLDGYLYITNEFSNEKKRLNDVKFKTLYNVYMGTNRLCIYALSNAGDVYKLYLENTNIEDVEFYRLDFTKKTIKFTNLLIKMTGCEFIGPVVLCEDDKMYDIETKLLYQEEYTKLYDKYILYDDNTISNLNGEMLVGYDSNNIEIVGYIQFDEDIFREKPKIGLITTSDNLVFLQDDKHLYVYNKEIKSIDNTDINKIKIIYNDNTYHEIKGYYISITNE